MSTQKTLTFHPTGGDLAISAIQDWRITVSDDAIASERYAAEEFQKWFNQATGLTFPLVTVQGRNAEADTTGRIAISGLPALGDEDLQITVESERILIQGGRPRGVLYAVYQLLEELVGIRFLTTDHTHVPDASALKIPCGSLLLFASVFVSLELLSRELRKSSIRGETESQHRHGCREPRWKDPTAAHQSLVPCVSALWYVR